ncbi:MULTISPECIES: LysR family transcriptional regulator [Ramlibacter]|uniref:LysR family transcriptional regulator n=1 Tax=Ramlibacter pinisoli TaxID=2682844 RepID=A0A6N8IST1_9BURK|nr:MULTISPECIES: LysR family transcriptional regulator [Ramlibacter]MBA2965006.1 LysR family transcriptional regulator [Ramlibacter sp. CGMCC 1.13660]MVQ29971.1 LysR family transcriptional regulator [Ramlibacter pinisoli]
MVPSLREIRLFVAVCEEQSFTAAAVREHATQSGVSQHIKNLEDRLGVRLLDRQEGVRPTPAGTAYYLRCL